MVDNIPFQDEDGLRKCIHCGITEEETTMLEKCPMCFSIFCGDCGYNFGGRYFCSKVCAEYFYFGEGDEEI